MLCGRLDRTGVWERRDTCTCMAVSLRCSPKNFTTLFVTCLYPNTKYSKEIRPVNPKGNQSWIFIRRTDAEAEAPVLWPPDVKRLNRKDTDAGEDGGQEEKGMTEDKMLGWHQRLRGHEFEQALGESGGQGSPACCSSWGNRVRHDLVTEQQLGESSWSEKTAYCIIPTVRKRQNYGDSKKISGRHRLMGRDGWTGGACRTFRAVKLLCMTL